MLASSRDRYAWIMGRNPLEPKAINTTDLSEQQSISVHISELRVLTVVQPLTARKLSEPHLHLDLAQP